MDFKINESILISVIIIFIYILYKIKQNRLTLVEANNNIKYMVYNDSHKKEAANILSELVIRMYKLKNHLAKTKESHPEYKQYINLLIENFSEDKTSIYENAPDSDLTKNQDNFIK
jgi:hypothetical protein